MGDVEGIMAALRARFGLTPMEARSKLVSLHREHRMSLQAHNGNKVTRFGELAYEWCDYDRWQDIALETISMTLGYTEQQ